MMLRFETNTEAVSVSEQSITDIQTEMFFPLKNSSAFFFQNNHSGTIMNDSASKLQKGKKIQQVKPISLPRHLCQMKTHPHGYEASVASIKQQRKFNQPLQNLFPPARVLHPDCKPQLPKITHQSTRLANGCLHQSQQNQEHLHLHTRISSSCHQHLYVT